jgi:dihydroflavonol-4-reductase
MDVLLTGATGLLGRYVADALHRRGHPTRALVRRVDGADVRALVDDGAGTVVLHRGSLDDESSLERAMRGVDAVIHCAAHLGGWSRDSREQRRTNVAGTLRLMEVAARMSVGRFVHVSTIGAVGFTREPRALHEDEPWDGARGPKLGYVRTKREAEERVLAAARSGFPALVLSPCSVVGVTADGLVRGGNCAAALSGRMRRAIPGGGSVVAARDVAESCVEALTRGELGQRYILGGENVTWLELAQATAAAARLPGPSGTWPLALGRGLAGVTGALDLVGLSHPAYAPERYRLWGWYTHANSGRAAAALGHRARPLGTALAELVEEHRARAQRRAPSGAALNGAG